MKFLFDLFPVLLFFVAYKTHGIIVATGVLMAATIMQMGYTWFKHRKLEKMHIITLVLVTIFGTATLLLNDPVYIQWKVSIINWLFALAFLGSQFIGSQTLTQRMYKTITLKKDIWTQVNLSWVFFFTAIGLINLYIMYNFDEATWVNFKLFGTIGLTFAFIILQMIFLNPYIETEKDSEKE